MRTIHQISMNPFQLITIRPGLQVSNGSNRVFHGLDGGPPEIQRRPTNVPQDLYPVASIETYIDEPLRPRLSNIQRSRAGRERPLLRNEWAVLRQNIDDDHPLHCSDMADFSKDVLVIAVKYVQDKIILARASQYVDYDITGVEIAVAKSWDLWQTQLEGLFTGGPLRYWRQAHSLYEKSTTELIFTVERLVQEVKPDRQRRIH